jgi:hypothetical protein
MINEAEITKRLIQKLLRLGYLESDLQAEVPTNYGRRIDLVVYESSKPKVVFEIKSNINLPSLSETDEFRFHPTVRQAQSLSQEVNAPNFAIFDGEQILWFDVDEQEGRPRLLRNPILPTKSLSETTRTEDQKSQVLKMLFELNDIGFGYFDSVEMITHIGMAIFARLLSETGDQKLEKLLQTPNPDTYAMELGFPDLDLSKKDSYKLFYPQAFLVLDKINLLEIQESDFLSALENFIQHNANRLRVFYPILPTWIIQLMASFIGKINRNETVLDIYSVFGNGIAAISSFDTQARILSISSNGYSFLWDKLKRLILGLSQADGIFTRRTQFLEGYENPFAQQMDHIIVAPPFGGREKSAPRISYSEDVYLERALRWTKPGGSVIAIVPENLLFSRNREFIRQLITDTALIRAIISLEQFAPGTSIKASIIVLNKKSPGTSQKKIMMSNILGRDIEITSDFQKSIRRNKKIQLMLDAYKNYRYDQLEAKGKHYWFIPPEDLSIESWSVSKYDPSVEAEITSEFPVFPLHELVAFKKGAHLTLDKKGSISVIGPAAVRELEVDVSKLDKTTKENIPQNSKPVRANDILIHALGTYRGQSAIVERDFENTFVSRNIIVLRALTPNLIPEYLAIALNSHFVRRQLEDRATGSVIAQLTIRKLEDVLIPVPDLDIQKAIVEKVYAARQKITEIEHQVLVVQSALKEQQETLQSILDNIHMGGGEDD